MYYNENTVVYYNGSFQKATDAHDGKPFKKAWSNSLGKQIQQAYKRLVREESSQSLRVA